MGNGNQKKSYIHVKDCIRAIEISVFKSKNNINIFNISNYNYCEVNDSVRWICKVMNLNPKLIYTGGDRGWVGDTPLVLLDINKIVSLGWKPQFTIQESIIETTKYLIKDH